MDIGFEFFPGEYVLWICIMFGDTSIEFFLFTISQVNISLIVSYGIPVN